MIGWIGWAMVVVGVAGLGLVIDHLWMGRDQWQAIAKGWRSVAEAPRRESQWDTMLATTIPDVRAASKPDDRA